MSKKLRVLWFVNTPSLASSKFGIKKDSSGSWIAAAELMIRKRANIDLAVAFLNLQGKTEKFIYRKRLYYSLAEKNFYSRRYWIYRMFHRLNSYKMSDLLWVIKDFNPDIIHVYGTEGPFGLISKKINIPVVIRIQGILSVWAAVWRRAWPPIKTLMYAGMRADLTGYGAFHQYRLYKKLVDREKQILKVNKYFVGQTDWDKKIIQSSNDQARYFRSNSIFREGFFEKTWKSKNTNKIKIFSVLTPAAYKGLDAVLEIARVLKERHVAFEWLIAGSAKGDYYINLTEKLKRDSFGKYNIKFLGVLDQSDVVRRMMECSVYVHPSHIENDSNSIIEALLLGVPVVTSQVGGIENFIKNGETGLLYSDYDYIDAADKIIGLCDNVEQIKFISKNARRKTRLLLNNNKSITGLINIYKEIIKVEKSSSH